MLSGANPCLAIKPIACSASSRLAEQIGYSAERIGSRVRSTGRAIDIRLCDSGQAAW
jgi:hypothetical protein